MYYSNFCTILSFIVIVNIFLKLSSCHGFDSRWLQVFDPKYSLKKRKKNYWISIWGRFFFLHRHRDRGTKWLCNLDNVDYFWHSHRVLGIVQVENLIERQRLNRLLLYIMTTDLISGSTLCVRVWTSHIRFKWIVYKMNNAPTTTKKAKNIKWISHSMCVCVYCVTY